MSKRIHLMVVFLFVLALLLPAHAQQPQAEKKEARIGGQLNFLGWEGYDNPAVFKPFYDQYGVVPNATYIGSNDEIISLYKAGGPGVYDMGNINSRYLESMIEQKMLMPLDESKLPNLKKFFPAWIKQNFGRGKDGKLYAVPAYSGYSAICYRADMVSEPKSWNYWQESPWKEKYAVGTNPMATVYLWAMTLGKGQDARKWTKKDLDEIKAYGMEKWKGAFTTAATIGEQIDLLVRGDVTTTDDCEPYATIEGQKRGADVRIALPAGPTKMWVNCYFIFAGARNSETAQAWINYATSKEVAAKMATNLGVAVTNQEAYELMTPELVKRVGFENMDETIMNAEFNVLPDSNAQDPYVKLSDIYRAFDEIKASASRQKSQ